jgi:RIO kinase 1
MSKKILTIRDFDEDNETIALERIYNQKHRRLKTARKDWQTINKLTGERRSDDQAEDRGFATTYKASPGERKWLLSALSPFYDNGLITDVLRIIKGGKEASVYCCTPHVAIGQTHIAAKVYRPRMFRNLRNDALYRLGTQTRDAAGEEMRKEREQRAIAKRTHFGQEVMHGSWLRNEVSTLKTLHLAGASVPKVYDNSQNAVMLEYFGDISHPAPPLVSVILPLIEANRVFEAIIENIRIMLRNEFVHADLSAYNILYWQGEIRIIDFPQALNVYRNPFAYDIFVRDVTRICDYFVQYGSAPDPKQLAKTLWQEEINA